MSLDPYRGPPIEAPSGPCPPMLWADPWAVYPRRGWVELVASDEGIDLRAPSWGWWWWGRPRLSLTTWDWPRALGPTVGLLASLILAELVAWPRPVFPGRALRRLPLAVVPLGARDGDRYEHTALAYLESGGLIERTTQGISILRRYWPAPYAYRPTTAALCRTEAP